MTERGTYEPLWLKKPESALPEPTYVAKYATLATLMISFPMDSAMQPLYLVQYSILGTQKILLSPTTTSKQLGANHWYLFFPLLFIQC